MGTLIYFIKEALRGFYQAKRDLGGVYAWLLRLASVRAVAVRLPRIMTQMFDFVSTETILDEPGHVQVQPSGIPYSLAEWLHTAIAIYGDTALKLAGAKTVSIQPPRAARSGRREAVATVTMVYDVRWT